MTSSLSLTGFVWKNLLRRRLRTFLTLCGIGMAVAAFVGLVGFSRAFEQQWMRIYSSSGIDIEVIQGTFLNTSMDESAAEKLKTLPVVAQATPTIFNVMDVTPEVNALVYGWKARLVRVRLTPDSRGAALYRWPAGSHAGRSAGTEFEKEAR